MFFIYCITLLVSTTIYSHQDLNQYNKQSPISFKETHQETLLKKFIGQLDSYLTYMTEESENLSEEEFNELMHDAFDLCLVFANHDQPTRTVNVLMLLLGYIKTLYKHGQAGQALADKTDEQKQALASAILQAWDNLLEEKVSSLKNSIFETITSQPFTEKTETDND